MLTAFIQLHFPHVQVSGQSEKSNSGNFIVRTSDGVVLSPYGFIDTVERKQMLLQKIQALSA